MIKAVRSNDFDKNKALHKQTLYRTQKEITL